MQTPSVKSLGSLIVKLAIGRTSERIRALLTLMRWAKLAGYGKVATLCSRLLERHGLYVSKNATIGDKNKQLIRYKANELITNEVSPFIKKTAVPYLKNFETKCMGNFKTNHSQKYNAKI